MNFTGQLFTPTPPTSYIGRFSVSPEQLPYISEHTTFLFAELDAHNSLKGEIWTALWCLSRLSRKEKRPTHLGLINLKDDEEQIW